MIKPASNFEWACAKLMDAIQSGMYGSITFSMQNGVIGTSKIETVNKPPVDNKAAKT